jgi:multisubunit Na+/H+ antiporter MnhF subunit
MISTALMYTLYFALIVHSLLIGYVVWRVGSGENGIDRLIGVDLISTLMVAVLVLITLVEQKNIFLDTALGLAALSFIGVVAFAKYVADKQMY